MILKWTDKENQNHTLVLSNSIDLNKQLDELREEGIKSVKNPETGEVFNLTTPTREEVKEYMILHNADEVGINNKWDMKQAKYFLLNDDKYHYINQ